VLPWGNRDHYCIIYATINKGRCLLPGCKPGQRIGSIDISKDSMPCCSFF